MSREVEAEAAELPHRARGGRAVQLASTQKRSHATHELRHRERLRHVVVRAELEAEHAIELTPSGGEHDDRDVALGSQGAADLDAREARQHPVEDDEVVPSRASSVERLLAVFGLRDLEALVEEPVAQDLEDRHVVLGDQDPGAHETSTSVGGSARGSSNQNVEPWPSTLSKPTLPPCASTIWRLSARPRPVPPIRRVSDESTRKNLEKTRSRSTTGIPSPRSTTRTRIAPSEASATISTGPPSGEYLIAFESRLPTTCSIRSRSASTRRGSRGR